MPSPASCAPPLFVATRHLAKGKGKKGGGGGKGKKAAAADAVDDDAEGADVKVDGEEVRLQMERPLEHLRKEYAAMATGRATPALLDSISVGGAGVSSLAKVLVQGPQMLQVACYDAASVPTVSKAIEEAPLNLRVEPQGKVIRVHVPRATQETRQALAKHVKVPPRPPRPPCAPRGRRR